MDDINFNERLYPKAILNQLKYMKTSVNSRMLTNVPKFIFLCGRDINLDNGGNRRKVHNFYQRINRKDIVCLYAEDLIQGLTESEIDLLTYEHYLAELSDGIILFVESWGTACELGAFATMDELVDKLVVFNSLEFESQASFINDGPIKKLKKTNIDKVVFADLEALFTHSSVDFRLRRFPLEKRCVINRDEEKVELKSFVIELLDLICLLGPIMQKDLINIYKYIKEFKSFKFCSHSSPARKKIRIGYVLELLKTANLITEEEQWLSINSSRYSFSGLMFNNLDKAGFRYNRIRSSIVSRKYRYKAGVEICL